MKLFTAKFYSEVIPDIVHQSEGIIHSVFNSSFNIQFGDRLIHIGPIENGLAPFGIGLNNQDAIELTRIVKEHEQVKWDINSKCLYFKNGCNLELKSAEQQHVYLAHKEIDISQIVKNRAYMIDMMIDLEWIGGLFDNVTEQQTILHYLKNPVGINRKELSEFNQKVTHLQSLVKNNTEPVEEVFDYWVGRGPGLTPSGDDMMTGICAALNIVNAETKVFTKNLHAYILEKGLKRTTPVAYEYLFYATKSGYHSSILLLCNALIDHDSYALKLAILEMKKMGHTSGVDTLLGILIGLAVILP